MTSHSEHCCQTLMTKRRWIRWGNKTSSFSWTLLSPFDDIKMLNCKRNCGHTLPTPEYCCHIMIKQPFLTFPQLCWSDRKSYWLNWECQYDKWHGVVMWCAWTWDIQQIGRRTWTENLDVVGTITQRHTAVNLGLYSFLGLRIGTNGELLWSAHAGLV
jgi:hypothetical protein